MTESLRGHYAGFVSRLFAYSLDLLVIIVIILFIAWLVQTISAVFQFEIIENLSSGIMNFILTGAAVLIIASFYFLFFWTMLGQTPGKMLLGLRIISTQGNEITFGQALRRYIGYYISALALFIGFLWVLVDNRRQGWHDKIAGTIVVYAWEAQAGGLYRAKYMENQPLEAGPEETSPSS